MKRDNPDRGEVARNYAALAGGEITREGVRQRGGGVAHAAQQHLVPAGGPAPAATPADDRRRDRDLARSDRPGGEEGAVERGHSSASPIRGSAWSAAISGARRFTASTASVHEGNRPEVSKTCSCAASTGGRPAPPHLLGGDDVVLDPHHAGHAGHAAVPGPKPRELHHEIDAPRDLAPQCRQRDVAAARHQHVLQPNQRIARIVRVQGAHRAGMARVHRLEHLVGLGAAHLADDDAVGGASAGCSSAGRAWSPGRCPRRSWSGSPGGPRAVAASAARPRPRW